ncbi:MAG: FadR/GntR family transcriptional regulator [bacterium]
MKDLLSEPIRRSTIPEEIIVRIKRMIEEGHLKEGSKLPPEREMAEMLGVSRPSLREALRALSLVGVLELRHGDGIYVSDFLENMPVESLRFMLLLKRVTLIELFETRKAIETELAGLAAMRASEEDLEAMKEALDAMKENLEDEKRYSHYEIAFHQAIAEASRNSLMLKIMQALNELLKESRRSTALFESIRDDFLPHERIFREIKDGNPEGARRAMFEHLDITQRGLQAIGMLEELSEGRKRVTRRSKRGE